MKKKSTQQQINELNRRIDALEALVKSELRSVIENVIEQQLEIEVTTEHQNKILANALEREMHGQG